MSSVRIGNASGFYGDRFTAMREMLEGGELDYLTGDYLAELTMLILGRDRMKDDSLGYAKTFPRQLQECLALAMERGVRIVTNAGGLNPAGLAARLRQIATEQGVRTSIAYVDGDDLRPRADELGFGDVVTANAYLGAFGIVEALRAGADVVVTGRVTDASVIVGPAAAHHEWDRDEFDALAGAVVAGHVIECGTQATGGNVAGFDLLELGSAAARRFGFPIAEIAADGSSVITKHSGTGGAVSVDTVTAQLVYEIDSPAYLGPDVVAQLDSVSLAQDGPDRVAISGVRGSPPPSQLKVCLNRLGGFRNTVDFVLTGLDLDAKAALVRAQLTDALVSSPPDRMEWQLERTERDDPATQAEATALLRCHVSAADPDRVGRAFTGAAVELALGSYPGFALTRPPASGTPYGVYSAAYVDQDVPEHCAVLPDGSRVPIPPPPALRAERGVMARKPPRPYACPSAGSRTPAAATRAATPTWVFGYAATTRTATTRTPGWRACWTSTASSDCSRRPPSWTSTSTGCRTCVPSTSCCTACSARACRRRRGSTRRPRRSASGCVPAWSRCPSTSPGRHPDEPLEHTRAPRVTRVRVPVHGTRDRLEPQHLGGRRRGSARAAQARRRRRPARRRLPGVARRAGR